jgi:STE24 endopeptidase
MNEDKAGRYQRLKRRASIASLVWSVGLLVALLLSGLSRALRDVAEAHAGPGRPALTVLLYVAGLLAIHESGESLLSFYSGFLLERRYGLSKLTVLAWAIDQLKAITLALVFSAGAASLVYWTMRRVPDTWWLWSGILFAAALVVLALLSPLVLLPLFYSIKPLGREALSRRLLALAGRAGADVVGVYEWGLGEKSTKANAALTGVGSTRRILISDTMLAEYSDDEIEVVLAHELAHHVHGDIWKGLVLESALVLGGFLIAALALQWAAPRLGLSGIADVAGLPLLLLAAGAVSLAAVPAGLSLSRAHERRADRFALQMTRNPAAFVAAMRRLGAQNLAEERPGRLVQWLFYGHPPLSERIAAADAFRSAIGQSHERDELSPVIGVSS